MSVAETFRRNRKITSTTSATVSEQRQLDVVNRLADRRRAIVADVERHRGRQLLADRRQQRLDRDRPPRRRSCPAACWIEIMIAALARCQAADLVVLDAVVDVRDLVEPHRIAVAVGDDRRPVRRPPASAGRWPGRRRSGLAVDRAGRQVRRWRWRRRWRPRRCRSTVRRELARVDVDRAPRTSASRRRRPARRR